MATDRNGGYRGARVGASLALTAVVIVIVLFDAFSAEYIVEPIVLGSLLAAILTLLGIEAVNVLRQAPPAQRPRDDENGR